MPRFQNVATKVVVNAPAAPSWGGGWERLGDRPTPPVEASKAEVVTEAVASDPIGAPTPPVEASRPNKAASRKAWAEYAQTLGVDVDGLTRAEIIEKVGA